MRKKIIGFILIFALSGLFYGQETNDQRYTQICTRGFEGYQKFRSDYGVNSRKEFWQYFYNLIRNFKDNKKFGNILACSEFWEEFKQDELFDFDEDARKDQVKINEIFASAQNGYKKDFKDKMLELEPIYLEGEKDPDKVKKYAADKKFAHIIQIYANNYKIISENPLPKQDKIDDIAALWQEMSVNNLVKKTIKKPIDDYFNKLNEFYRIQIRERDSYDQKLKTTSSKKTKLEEIKTIAASIDHFSIKEQLSQIRKMIRTVDSEVKYWQLHKTVDDMIAAFEKKPNPTLDDLYLTKKKVKEAAQEGQSWEPSLYKRIKFFWELQEKKYLDTEWFEENVEPHRNNNSKIIKVLLSVYKKMLFGKVVKKMNAGGDSVEDLTQIEILTDKYKRLFNKETGKEGCIALIRRYYDAKQELDYPEMIKLYEENPNIVSACDNVVRQAWHLKSSKEAVKAEYRKLYSKLMHEALDDEGRKYESTFDAFWLIHQKKVWVPPDDYKIRFKYLKTYYKSRNFNARQKAAKDLHASYPSLAYSYRIPDPEEEIMDGSGRESIEVEESYKTEDQPRSPDTAENDYKKLVKMWQAVKGMKTEQEVVKYIRHQAPLRINGSISAEKTLDKIIKWHNQWSIFEKTSFKELKALAMIGEMLTWSDNIRDQNKLYKHIIIRMSEANIISFTMPEPEKSRTMTLKLINKIIDNNNEYLNLLNGNQRGKNLNSIEEYLKHNLLTVPQKVRAYYQFGILSTVGRKNLHVPPCYHFAKAWKLMDEKGYTELNLDWNGSVIIRKSDLARKISLHCNLVKRSQTTRDEFNRQYPRSNLDIDALCEKAGRSEPYKGGKPSSDSTGSGIKTKSGTTGVSKQEKIINKFMEEMLKFVKNEILDDPALQAAFMALLNTDLSGPELNKTINEYKTFLPPYYDGTMNRFFRVIYVRAEGWVEKATRIIKAASWKPMIKNKLKEVLNNMKVIY